MTPTLLLALFASAPAAAQEAFGLSPGAQSGGLLDAPSTSVATGPATGTGVLGAALSYSVNPVQVCGFEAGAGETACLGANADPWVRGSTGLFLSGAHGLGERLSWGGDLRLRVASSQAEEPTGWANNTALPWQIDGIDRAALEDLSLYGQVGLLRARRSQLALQLRAHVDRELTPDLWGGPATTDATHTAWLYGSGTGLSGRAVFTTHAERQPGERWPAWQTTVEAGLMAAPLPERCGGDCASAGGDTTAPLGSPLPDEGTLSLRGAGAFRVHPDVAALAEVDLAWGGVAATSRSEVRAGARWRPSRSGDPLPLDVTALLGHSPTLAIGDPALRVVLGVRWTPAAPTPVPFPARASEASIWLRDSEGALLTAVLGGDLQGAEARVGPSGETVVAIPAKRPLRISLSAEGRATWTETLELTGPGPWRIDRVLPAGGGQGTLDLSLYDVDGEAIPEAQVTLGDQALGAVCGTCEVTLEGLPQGSVDLTTDAPTFGASTRPVVVAPVDPDDVRPAGIYLTRPPGSVHVTVRDPRGPRPDAVVTLVRATGVETVTLGTAGEQWLTLDPGRFRVRVTADGMGAQERTLFIEEDDLHLHELDFQLFPAQQDGASLSVEALNAEGAPVEGAEIRLGDRPLGRTGSGGGARFEDLAQGDAVLTVAHPRFRAYPSQAVALSPGATTELLTPLSWQAGQVAVDVVDENGFPVDATVRIEQGGRLEAVDRTGPDGRLNASLQPGTWQVTATAPGKTAVTLEVDVPVDRTHQLRAEVVLLPAAPDGASLELTVLDKLDKPVEFAEVTLDGAPLGRTSSGGRLALSGIAAGDRALQVTGDYYDPWNGRLRANEGQDAEATARLKERLGLVTVTATTESGEPVDAFVRFLGPLTFRPRRLGPDGQERFRLGEGLWEVLYSSEVHGLHAEDVDVERTEPKYVVKWTTPDVEAAAAPAAIAPLPRREATVSLWSRATDSSTAGTLRLLGPEVLPPVQVGEDGTWTGPLQVGWWEALATADALGIGGGDLDVAREGPDPELRIELGEARVEVTDQQVEIKDAIYFEVDSAVIEGRSASLLEEVARTIRSRPEIKRIRIEGHTDAQGTADHNLDLSARRAAAVQAALIDLGVERRRLETEGLGDTQPVATNATAAGRAENRRVVFRVLRVKESSVADPRPAPASAPE